MTHVDVKKLLNPLGPAVQEAVKGARNEGRIAVAMHWPEIEAALDAGLTIAAIHRVLSKAGLVGVTVRSFQRQVLAHREDGRSSGAPAKPTTVPRPSAESAETSQAATSDAPAQAEAARPKPPEIKPGIPHRPWRTGPYQPPDPNAVFRARDPLADD